MVNYYYIKVWLGLEMLNTFCRGEHYTHQRDSDVFIEMRMKKGHWPGGIIGTTENPQRLRQGDLRKMSGDEENVHAAHMEESATRIRRDGYDRQTTRVAVCPTYRLAN